MTKDRALLRLLQLASPALPVGAYAYSQGLETAVEEGWIDDEASTQDWLIGVLSHSLAYLDVPIFARLYRAWATNDEASVSYWNDTLYACRESKELQQEERHLGTALARLLTDLEITEAAVWRSATRVCFALPFSLASVRWKIALQPAISAYLWAWAENQVAAATKLVPLGQTASQRILSALMPSIEDAVATGLALADDEIGCSLPALGLASIMHETQYSRLFRS